MGCMISRSMERAIWQHKGTGYGIVRCCTELATAAESTPIPASRKVITFYSNCNKTSGNLKVSHRYGMYQIHSIPLEALQLPEYGMYQVAVESMNSRFEAISEALTRVILHQLDRPI